MSDKELSYLSTYVSADSEEPLSKVLDRFTKNEREILVFSGDLFLGYITKQHITRQTRLTPEYKVGNLTKKVSTVNLNASFDTIARLILSNNTRSVPVEQNRKIIGVFRDIDILDAAEDVFGETKIDELMTKNPLCLTAESSAAQFIALCRTENISRVPITDDSGKLMGIVSPHDITAVLTSKFPRTTTGHKTDDHVTNLSYPLKELMTTSVITCKNNDFVVDAIKKLKEADHKALVVVDDDDHPTGILTTTDLLETVSHPPQTEGYYVKVIGAVDEEDIEQVVDMGMDTVKKFAPIIGNSGHLYIHCKAYDKKKFRGFSSYQIRLRIVAEKGKTYNAKAEGYGLFPALAVAIDRIERSIISDREVEIQRHNIGRSKRLLADEEDLEEWIEKV